MVRWPRARFLVVILVAGLIVAAGLAEGQDQATGAKRVLFVGNSLTFWNDLPLLVEAMAKARGIILECEAATGPDLSIEDHWNRGTRDLIRDGDFSHVILQQGPSSLASSRANLREWTQRIATDIRASGARPALYMVWPDRSRLAYFAQVRESYRLANEDVDGLLLPAGEAWQAAWKLDPKLDLYGPDGFHPSKLGTYAAAATIFSRLTKTSPLDLPAKLRLRNGEEYKVDGRKAAIVLRAVAELTPP
jgi:hypothetical protein